MSDPEPRRFWFALKVRSRYEKLVSTALRQKGYEEFLPTCRHRHRHAGKLRWVELPLFSTYTFCRFDPAQRLPILMIPGVLSVVGTINGPVPVDEAELDAIRAVVKSGLNAEPCPLLRAGDRVRIETGPLKGLEGTLVRGDSRCKIVLSLSLLQRSVAVEIDRFSVRFLAAAQPTDALSGSPDRLAPSLRKRAVAGGR